MPFTDSEAFSMIDRLGEHYRANINTRFMRQAFSRLLIPQLDWQKIDRLTNQTANDKIQGYRFWELYERILAMANFISRTRKEIVPNIRSVVSSAESLSGSGESAQGNAIFRDMVIANFGTNLDVLADMLHLLYIRVTTVDKSSHKVKAPVYTRVPGLDAIGKLLIG
jgi:hypothetical protein